MALQAINTRQTPNLTVVESPVIIEDYVFENAITLPKGNWLLTIEKGDAWIFLTIVTSQ